MVWFMLNLRWPIAMVELRLQLILGGPSGPPSRGYEESRGVDRRRRGGEAVDGPPSRGYEESRGVDRRRRGGEAVDGGARGAVEDARGAGKATTSIGQICDYTSHPSRIYSTVVADKSSTKPQSGIEAALLADQSARGRRAGDRGAPAHQAGRRLPNKVQNDLRAAGGIRRGGKGVLDGRYERNPGLGSPYGSGTFASDMIRMFGENIGSVKTVLNLAGRGTSTCGTTIWPP